MFEKLNEQPNLEPANKTTHEFVFATSLRARLVGLLSPRVCAKGETLVLAPCNSIHTHGMKESIDVAFVDATGQVLLSCPAVPPGSSLRDRRAVAVLERRVQTFEGEESDEDSKTTEQPQVGEQPQANEYLQAGEQPSASECSLAAERSHTIEPWFEAGQKLGLVCCSPSNYEKTIAPAIRGEQAGISVERLRVLVKS
ncbi:MAG: DUF192 domain-containing protein [Coriobacteriia bacterium]|nr:DUF192 domain-containing protein [Coriobacteriia bacterium]